MSNSKKRLTFSQEELLILAVAMNDFADNAINIAIDSRFDKENWKQNLEYLRDVRKLAAKIKNATLPKE